MLNDYDEAGADQVLIRNLDNTGHRISAAAHYTVHGTGFIVKVEWQAGIHRLRGNIQAQVACPPARVLKNI